MKTVIHHEDGSVTVEWPHPDRALEGVLAMLRARTSHRIETRCPPHDRENAALGLIDPAPIRGAIAAERAAFADARARAEAAHGAWDRADASAAAASAAILAALEEPCL